MLLQFALHYLIINSKFGAIKAIFFKIIQTDGVYISISTISVGLLGPIIFMFIRFLHPVSLLIILESVHLAVSGRWEGLQKILYSCD